MPQQNVDNKTASQNADLAKRAQLPNDIEAEQKNGIYFPKQ